MAKTKAVPQPISSIAKQESFSDSSSEETQIAYGVYAQHFKPAATR
jgi:hypothetical protein